MSRRIGILGGTFDPIHRGHTDLGVAAQGMLGLDRVLVVPTHTSPHRPQPAASIFHRFAMVALALAGRRTWRASDLELRYNQPSFTMATLERFHARGYAPAELFFIIGGDAFAEITTWRDYPDLLEATNFAVVSRPGYPVAALRDRLPELSGRMFAPTEAGTSQPLIFLIDAPTFDVSSTAIRELRQSGRPITGMVDLAVQHHIEQHGLYTAAVPDRRGFRGAASEPGK
ncbi:MAG TPA: nicotinate-nucleotide adenylyltransferase [Vicinamibacterales bacterium]|jgi:nicotinate-nucleotide adenylyltransferase|nr:nicotinate-nucleotide adenylyltransferase [Vicinamibacterales bacterium]